MIGINSWASPLQARQQGKPTCTQKLTQELEGSDPAFLGEVQCVRKKKKRKKKHNKKERHTQRDSLTLVHKIQRVRQLPKDIHLPREIEKGLACGCKCENGMVELFVDLFCDRSDN